MLPVGMLASDRKAEVLKEMAALADCPISKLTDTPVVGPPNANDPEEFIVMANPYGEVKPYTLFNAMKFPLLSIEAIAVEP